MSSSPVRVLIADDDPNYRTYLAALTRKVGLETEMAGDGEDAFRKLCSGPFDLLLSDYEMPRRNGLELIKAIRVEESLMSLYAVMLTAHDDVALKIEALTLGYDDFLPKNCTEVEVLAKVAAARRLLARQRALDQAVREWQGIASRDELTGVCSRRFFFEEATRTLAEGHAIGIILLDLDNFKQVNDTHGHLTGDRILRDIGSQFLRRTRHGDIIARFGGDEFVLLVTGLSLDEMRNVGKRVASDLEMLQWSSGSDTLRVTATIGVSSSTLISGATVDQVLEAADRDLYLNKWMRKNPSATPEDLYRYERERTAEVVRLRTRSMERDERQQKG